MFKRLDQTSPGVREGMRVTFKLLNEMNSECRLNNIEFVVAVIPTKETVFADYLEHNRALPLSAVLDKVIANERIARQKLFEFFDASGIHYVDTLPALRRSVQHELYARTAQDIHPNKNGYKVIAEAIAADLQNRSSAGRSATRVNSLLQ
jgi:lysophospholipase L1-like esterase